MKAICLIALTLVFIIFGVAIVDYCGRGEYIPRKGHYQKCDECSFFSPCDPEKMTTFPIYGYDGSGNSVQIGTYKKPAPYMCENHKEIWKEINKQEKLMEAENKRNAPLREKAEYEDSIKKANEYAAELKAERIEDEKRWSAIPPPKTEQQKYDEMKKLPKNTHIIPNKSTKKTNYILKKKSDEGY